MAFIAPRLRKTAVVATVPSDSHTWNLVYLHLLLAENGYEVRNLGACSPTDEVLDACRVPGTQLLAVSSINGHGLREGAALIAAVRCDPALADLRAVIGGMLTTNADGDLATRELAAAGYDGVFVGEGAVQRFRQSLAVPAVVAGAGAR